MKLFLESGNRTHGVRGILAVVAHAAREAAVGERAEGIVLRVGVGFTRPADRYCGFAADLLERFVQPRNLASYISIASRRVGQRKPSLYSAAAFCASSKLNRPGMVFFGDFEHSGIGYQYDGPCGFGVRTLHPLVDAKKSAEVVGNVNPDFRCCFSLCVVR